MHPPLLIYMLWWWWLSCPPKSFFWPPVEKKCSVRCYDVRCQVSGVRCQVPYILSRCEEMHIYQCKYFATLNISIASLTFRPPVEKGKKLWCVS